MTRFLTPREHGAYAQLAFPLLSGLILGRPTLAAIGFAIAALSIFFAYEPAAVLLGVRGARLQREHAGVARLQLMMLAPMALVAGAGSLSFGPASVRLLAAVPAGLCALLVPLVPVRRVKTVAGETLVAGALASMHLPVAAAGGVSGLRLWAPAALWFTVFFLATLAVHAIKARHKQRAAWVGAVSIVSSAVAVAGSILLAVMLPALRTFGLVLAVPLVAVLVVNLANVRPHALRRVGWTLVAVDTAALALLLLLR